MRSETPPNVPASIPSWKVPNSTIGAGAAVIEGDKILLVQVNYGPAKGGWIFPGGRVEAGEKIDEALKREVKEETGLSVLVEGLVGFRQRLMPDIPMDFYFIFLCKVDPSFPRGSLAAENPEELTAVKFWPIEEALKSKDVRINTQKAIRMAVEKKNLLKPLGDSDIPAGNFLFC